MSEIAGRQVNHSMLEILYCGSPGYLYYLIAIVILMGAHYLYRRTGLRTCVYSGTNKLLMIMRLPHGQKRKKICYTSM